MRGSRKHILSLVEHSGFTDRLSQLLYPTGATIQTTDEWMPKGFNDHEEARLKWFNPLPAHIRQDLQDWWLVHKRGANTPNWDLASTCIIQGQQGLVLVEAKAHTNELKTEGKPLARNASRNSRQNHDRIGKAINEASQALAKVVPGVNISRDTHYQLANRIAFSCKIASLGIPVILVYLGFLGDKNMRDVGGPLRDDAHWRQIMRAYTDKLIPENFIDRWIDCGKAEMQMIIRSLQVE